MKTIAIYLLFLSNLGFTHAQSAEPVPHTCHFQYQGAYGEFDLQTNGKSRSDAIEEMADRCFEALRRNPANRETDPEDLILECANQVPTNC